MNKKDIDFFVGITGVSISPTPIGLEISPLFRYNAEKESIVEINFSFIASGDKRKTFCTLPPTEKIVEKQGPITFANAEEMAEGVIVIAKFKETKSIFEFSYKQGKIIPKF